MSGATSSLQAPGLLSGLLVAVKLEGFGPGTELASCRSGSQSC